MSDGSGIGGGNFDTNILWWCTLMEHGGYLQRSSSGRGEGGRRRSSACEVIDLEGAIKRDLGRKSAGGRRYKSGHGGRQLFLDFRKVDTPPAISFQPPPSLQPPSSWLYSSLHHARYPFSQHEHGKHPCQRRPPPLPHCR